MNAASGAMTALDDPPPPHPDASTERMQIRIKIVLDRKFVNAENVNHIMLLHRKLLGQMAAHSSVNND